MTATLTGRAATIRWLRAGYIPEHVVLAAVPAIAGALVATAIHGGPALALACTLAAVLDEIGGRYVNYHQDLVSGVDGDPAHLPPDHPARSGYPDLEAMHRVGIALLVGFGVLATLISAQVHPALGLLGPLLAGLTYAYAGGGVRWGHRGLAEIGRFIATGLMATGTAIALDHTVEPAFVAVGVQYGALAVAGMTIQNIRDRTVDRRGGKRTVPAAGGARAGRALLAGATVTSAIAALAVGAWIGVPAAAGTGLAALTLNLAPDLGRRHPWGWYVHPRLTVAVYLITVSGLVVGA